VKFTNSYILCLLGLLLAAGLSFLGKQVPEAIYLIISAYVLGRAGQKASYVMSAAKDAQANTHNIIKDIEGVKRDS
jgi:hypothetical protein